MKFNKWTIVMAALLFGAVELQAQTIGADLQNIWDLTLGSSNTVFAPFAERKLTGNADSAGLVVAYNFNGTVAVIGGIDEQWMRGGPNATYNLSGGLQLQAKLYPFKSWGLTNFYVNPFVVTAVGTPMNGANNGNLMNANRVGANIPIHTFTINNAPLAISAGGFYGNQTGTGPFDGNWGGIDAAVNYGSKASSLAANDLYLRDEYAQLEPRF